jgi:hypothetical protein
MAADRSSGHFLLLLDKREHRGDVIHHRLPGVDKVAVSLTHEQALVEYDPAVARPEQLLRTLRDIGYTISDPRKLRAFEEEERDLMREGRRFVVAVALSVAAIPIIADPAVGWIGFLPALVCLSLGGFVFLVLRSSGFWTVVVLPLGQSSTAFRRSTCRARCCLNCGCPPPSLLRHVGHPPPVCRAAVGFRFRQRDDDTGDSFGRSIGFDQRKCRCRGHA